MRAEVVFCVIGNFVPITQKRSAGMRTAAYNADVASDRRRRKNVPRHILCSLGENAMDDKKIKAERYIDIKRDLKD